MALTPRAPSTPALCRRRRPREACDQERDSSTIYRTSFAFVDASTRRPGTRPALSPTDRNPGYPEPPFSSPSEDDVDEQFDSENPVSEHQLRHLVVLPGTRLNFRPPQQPQHQQTNNPSTTGSAAAATAATRPQPFIDTRRRVRHTRGIGQQQQQATPMVATTSLREWEDRMAARLAARLATTKGEEPDRAIVAASTPVQAVAAATVSAPDSATPPQAPRRDTVFHDGGNIPLQDKFGLLLSFCSVLVSVQWLIPRLL